MFHSILFFIALSLPLVQADGWDDFSNNLATDLAPFLSLFGEQVTKQYLSESITLLDYFIFAMAPMGILTAIVSAIRVCGSPSLRALIGRAQEGGGNAEAELCSSTSWDVCELFNNGSIARIFGRPKILEIVHDRSIKSPEFDANADAGIFTFQHYPATNNGKKEWTKKGSNVDPKAGVDVESDMESTMDMFAPNLSLNIGIKRRHPAVFALVGAIGLILQAGVLAFAVVVTYCLKWEKEDRLPDPYACPLVIIGAVLLCGGVFLCAYVVGQSTQEQVFDRIQDGQPRSTIYWLQPGGQVLGDQTFHSFSYNDLRQRSLERYTTSWKTGPQRSQRAVWGVVCITITGFVLQFIGLRGIHSAVSIAQLGAIMVMSAARAALRMQRLKPENNFLATYSDQIVGHELDWLAFSIGEGDVEDDLGPSSDASNFKRHYFWRFSGSSEKIVFDPQSQPPAHGSNAAGKLLAYRSRLAELTESPAAHVKLAPASRFEMGMVEIRRMAKSLTVVIESAANALYSGAFRGTHKWENSNVMYWGFKCAILQKQQQQTSSPEEIAYTTKSAAHVLYLQLRRDSSTSSDVGSRWKLRRGEDLEALLGLWVWSLKSDPEVARILEIPARRIVASDEKVAEQLKRWIHGQAPNFLEFSLDANRLRDSNTIWELREPSGHHLLPLSGNLSSAGNPNRYVRLFGWHAIEPLNLRPSVWTATCQSSLLSLCAQEVFASFFKDIMGILKDIGKIEIQEEHRGFRLANRLVSDIIDVFVEAGIGSRDDAMLCILPSVVSDEIRARRTSLFYAAESGHDAVVKLLLEEVEVDINIEDSKGRTPLSQAAAGGHGAVVKLLLEKRGADVNIQDHRGCTPLSQAAANGHEVVVKLLLEQRGTEVDLKDRKGRAPLWLAAANGHEAVVKLLLEKGKADVHTADNSGQTPLSKAAANWHDSVVKLLFAHVSDPDSGWRNQRTIGTANSQEQEDASEDFLENLNRFRHDRETHLRSFHDTKGARRGWRGPIKIAVLSTGITRHRPLFRQAMRPIKTMVNFIKSGSPTDINDVEGHGTTMAQVLLKACPVAEIYVAKVAQTIHEPETDHAIAKAIIWATEHCDVDIIVMPFGFKKSHETIDKAILFAHEKSKVMFAPAGHEGPDGPRAYPARSPFVIAMHIADGYGRDAGFNPSPLEHDDNFSTLGFALVPDIWGPRQVLRSGADVAVAVATGIAACLLEYALSMLPLTSSDDKQWLCSSDGIRELLRLVSTKKDGYRFIAPWLVWGEDNTANDVRDLLMAIVQRRKVLKGRST